MDVIADDRWIGPHGIGRFAKEVLKRINYRSIGISGSPSAPMDPLKLSFALSKRGSKKSLFFSPGYNAPLFYSGQLALTIHDLIHLDIAEESSLLKKAYYNKVVLPAVHNSKIVFTVSQYSKNKIAEWSKIDEDKIIVVGNGVDDVFLRNEQKFDMESKYFLYVGNQKAHKNTAFMIKAFSKSAIHHDAKLLFMGHLTVENKRLVTSLKIENRVVELGFVEESALPLYYKGASALIMPSLYEGFGLPIVEAMASSTLVLSSNTSCLPEVAGDIAIYFDPEKEEELIATMLFALSDDSDIERRTLLGKQRAYSYSWDKVAEKVAGGLSSI